MSSKNNFLNIKTFSKKICAEKWKEFKRVLNHNFMHHVSIGHHSGNLKTSIFDYFKFKNSATLY